MKVEIYLKSGQNFAFEADNVTVSTGRSEGDFRSLRWSNDNDRPLKGKILFLDGAAVDAVVTRKK